MKRLNNILLSVFLLFFAVNGRAQGDVVVHTDPRLSLLLKKTHPAVMASSARVPSHKTLAATIPTHDAAPSHTAAPHDAVAPHTPDVLATPHATDMAVHSTATNVKTSVLPAVKAPPPVAIAWAPKRTAHTIYTGKGYRVQIYNGTDRSKAMEIKNEFARNNPGVRTYLSYISPCFRVKVGDYRRRAEAEGMWREANSTYNPSMIVPDIITVTTME